MSPKSIKSLLSVLTLGAVSLLAALPAAAQTANTPLDSADIRASIASSCSVSVATLAFGSYLSTGTHATNPLDAQAVASVTCTAGTTGLVAHIMQGAGAGATCNNESNVRSMKHSGSAEVISYKLYQDTDRTVEWGCSTTNGVTYPEFTTSATAVTRTIYGRIPPGQYIQTGNYSDNIQFRVTF